MRMEFQSADDYLSHLQAIYSSSYTDGAVADSEFHQRTIQKLQRINLEMPVGPVAGLQIAIGGAYRNVVEALSPVRRTLVGSSHSSGRVRERAGQCFYRQKSGRKIRNSVFVWLGHVSS
jgi:hypothetical protein